jgi:hypothetical protein
VARMKAVAKLAMVRAKALLRNQSSRSCAI